MMATAEQPLVSCIMPTADRRRFVPLAIQNFLQQDYPNRELVILDDGQDSVADLAPADFLPEFVTDIAFADVLQRPRVVRGGKRVLYHLQNRRE